MWDIGRWLFWRRRRRVSEKIGWHIWLLADTWGECTGQVYLMETRSKSQWLGVKKRWKRLRETTSDRADRLLWKTLMRNDVSSVGVDDASCIPLNIRRLTWRCLTLHFVTIDHHRRLSWQFWELNKSPLVECSVLRNMKPLSSNNLSIHFYFVFI